LLFSIFPSKPFYIFISSFEGFFLQKSVKVCKNWKTTEGEYSTSPKNHLRILFDIRNIFNSTFKKQIFKSTTLFNTKPKYKP